MDSYSPLLERTRFPQPSFQKLAVISIFEKLRTSPPYLNPDSNPGRDAISQCLNSNSSHVIDQAVRELCRLVKDGILSTSRGLLELQSSLAGCDSRFVDVFVKGIGFLVRIGFQKNELAWDVDSTESHPFVRVVLCRIEVQSELVQQVLLFIVQNKQMGLVKVLEFLRPFMNNSILRIPFEPSSSSLARQLVSDIASLCCSIPSDEALHIIKWLTERLKSFPRENSNDYKDVFYIAECLVNTYTVALTQATEPGLLKNKVHIQSCGVELVETLLAFYTDLDKHFGGMEAILELSKRLLLVQRQHGLQYFSELSSVLASLFIILSRTEFEHEQLSVTKISLFLLKWENEDVYVDRQTARQALLFLLPVINLMSSPSGSVKAAATDMLSVLEKF